MKGLRSLIDELDAALPTLPSAHTTDGFSFRQILEERAIKPSSSPPFDEPLTFFFYGRPAYRVLGEFGPTTLSCFATVCIVVDTATLPPPKRILPFDSGAWARGCYADFMHPKMAPSDFELQGDYSQAGKVVTFFFGSNASYYLGLCRKDLPLDPFDMEAECLRSMLSSPQRTVADDRRGSIELQVAGEVDLAHTKVVAVILSTHFMDDPIVRRFCRNVVDAEMLSYDCYHAKPSDDTRAVMDVLGRFLRERGLL